MLSVWMACEKPMQNVCKYRGVFAQPQTRAQRAVCKAASFAKFMHRLAVSCTQIIPTISSYSHLLIGRYTPNPQALLCTHCYLYELKG